MWRGPYGYGAVIADLKEEKREEGRERGRYQIDRKSKCSFKPQIVKPDNYLVYKTTSIRVNTHVHTY